MTEASGNVERRIEAEIVAWLKGELEAPVRRTLSALALEIDLLARKVDRINMTMGDIESKIKTLSDRMDAITTEVGNIIAKLTAATGGITAADAAQIAADLQAVIDKANAVPGEPA